MRVRYIGKSIGVLSLTDGKIYEVLGVPYTTGKQKTEELCAKWRERVDEPDYVPTSYYDADMAQP